MWNFPFDIFRLLLAMSTKTLDNVEFCIVGNTLPRVWVLTEQNHNLFQTSFQCSYIVGSAKGNEWFKGSHHRLFTAPSWVKVSYIAQIRTRHAYFISVSFCSSVIWKTQGAPPMSKGGIEWGFEMRSQLWIGFAAATLHLRQEYESFVLMEELWYLTVHCFKIKRNTSWRHCNVDTLH